MAVSVCVCVCVFVCLFVCLPVRKNISGNTRPVFIMCMFLCMLPMAASRSSSDGVGIRYVLPVYDVTLAHKPRQLNVAHMQSRTWLSCNGPITIAIRARFEYDSSTIQHLTRSYVLSSNNEHVNSFALL